MCVHVCVYVRVRMRACVCTRVCVCSMLSQRKLKGPRRGRVCVCARVQNANTLDEVQRGNP